MEIKGERKRPCCRLSHTLPMIILSIYLASYACGSKEERKISPVTSEQISCKANQKASVSFLKTCSKITWI